MSKVTREQVFASGYLSGVDGCRGHANDEKGKGRSIRSDLRSDVTVEGRVHGSSFMGEQEAPSY